MPRKRQKLTKTPRSYADKNKRIAYKRRVRLWVRRGLHVVLILLVLGFLIHTGWTWYHGNIASMRESIGLKLIESSKELGLTLENVYISGQYNMQAGEITEALALRQGEPIMDISLNELKDKVEALGWVREATIERQLPGTLHVRIVERRPVAIWQNQGELRLVDIEGKIITKGVEGAKENFGNLPIVVGENANEHVSLVFGFLMKEPELFMLVSSVIRVGDRRWNVRFKNGMEIKLPEKKADAAWRYLGKLSREKAILKRDIESVDLRLPDRVFIKTRSGQAITP